MTQTRRPPRQEPGESRNEYYERLWEFFDLDNDSGEYKPGMTELEAQVRVWKLKKERLMPSPAQIEAAAAKIVKRFVDEGVLEVPEPIHLERPEPAASDMAPHSLEETYERMERLAQEFAESLSEDELDHLRSDSRRSLFAWALSRSTQLLRTHFDLDALVDLFPEDSPAGELLKFVVGAIEDRFGELPVPDLPAVDQDLQVSTRLVLDEVGPDIDCPRKLTRSARFVASTCIRGGLDISWPTRFHLSTNRSRSHWILWEEWEDEWYRWQSEPVAWCRKKGLGPNEAACHLLRAIWQDAYDCWGEDWTPGNLESGRLIPLPQLRILVHEIWPEAYPIRS